MTDNTNMPRLEAPSQAIQASATKAKEAVLYASVFDKLRDYTCVSKSPRECLVLTFTKLTI